LFINLTIETRSGRQDVRIDSEQKIGDGVAILRQHGKLRLDQPPDYYRSRMSQKLVSAYRTFTEERIFDGDILTAVEN